MVLLRGVTMESVVDTGCVCMVMVKHLIFKKTANFLTVLTKKCPIPNHKCHDIYRGLV